MRIGRLLEDLDQCAGNVALKHWWGVENVHFLFSTIQACLCKVLQPPYMACVRSAASTA
jgi:hypothetical protein